MNKLETASPLFVVRGRTPAHGVPREGEHIIHPSMLQLPVGGRRKPHPANYRGCRHAKGELQKKKSQRSPKTTTGSVFSSARTIPGISLAVALRGSGDQQQQPQAKQVSVASPRTTVKQNIPASALQQETGQSVQAPHVSSQPFDNMLKVVTVVQQNVTEGSVALTEEKKSGNRRNFIKAHVPEWPQEFIGLSKSQHLMRTALGGSPMSSVNTCKIYM
jgi:hypothetical protein